VAARFKFRLEALLKVRHSLEEEAQRQLARVMATEAAAQAKVAALRQNHGEVLESRRMAANQVVDLKRWADTERFLLVLEARILTAEEAHVFAQHRVAEARAALLKAHQDHLMLARLKERRLEQHNLEVQREEARDMDEMAVLRYRINHASPGPVSGPSKVTP
jgi:flagellar export protein FliJ